MSKKTLLAAMLAASAGFAVGVNTSKNRSNGIQSPQPSVTEMAVGPARAALRRYGHDVSDEITVQLTYGRTYEAAEKNTKAIQAALDSVANAPYETAIYLPASSEPVYLARVSDVERAKKMRVAQGAALSEVAAPEDSFGLEKRRLLGAPLPCFEVPSGCRLVIDAELVVLSDHQSAFHVLDDAVVVGSTGLITTDRFRHLGGSYERPSIEPFSNQIFPAQFLPPTDGDTGYALKGGNGRGFAWDYVHNGEGVDSYTSNASDTSEITHGGYNKQFPQMDKDGRYSGSTAQKWGYHNGYNAGSTGLVYLLASDGVAELHGLRIIGSVGHAVVCGIRKPVRIVSNHIISHLELYRHYAGGIQVECCDIDKISFVTARAMGPDSYTAYEVHGAPQAGYGISRSRDPEHGLVEYKGLDIADCRHRALDTHVIVGGVVVDSFIRGCDYGFSAGFTGRNFRGELAYAPYAPVVLRFSRCVIEGVYGVDCDNADTFDDVDGPILAYVFVDKTCEVHGFYAVKNIYPRAIFASDGAKLVKSEKFAKKNGQQSQIGLWVGSVNASRGNFKSDTVISVRTRDGGFPKGNHVVVHDAIDMIRVVTDSNKGDCTIPTTLPRGSFVRTATGTVEYAYDFEFKLAKYSRSDGGKEYYKLDEVERVYKIVQTFNTGVKLSTGYLADVKRTLSRIATGELVVDAALKELIVPGVVISVSTPGNSVAINVLKEVTDE